MRRAVVVLLLLIANAVFGSKGAGDARASHGVSVPGTPPGKLLQDWLTAYNAADEDALREYAHKRYTPEARNGRSAKMIAENWIEGRQSTRGFELLKIESSTPTELAAVIQAKNAFPRILRLSLKVAENDPSRLVERKVGSAPTPPEQLKTHSSGEEFAKALDATFEELTKKDEFSGAALIGKDGEQVWQKAYGLQDREKKTPVNLDTRFRLGSMNKMFTSVAIAQLVDAGKLKFTDTLATVWPEYPNKEIAQKVTIHHLLTHASGLGDFFGPAFFEKIDALRDVGDYVPLFAEKPLQFEPGAKWSYSNAGFIVLGVIIEKLSGQNYYDYVAQHIFAPAGMTATGSTPKTERPENLAVGYMHDPRSGKLVPNWETLPWRGMSAGGGESTVGDVLRFAKALRSYKLLSRETTELIVRGKVDDQPGSPARYAYGFSDRNENGRRSVGHNGGAPGMNGSLNILWDEGYAVVVLANIDPTVAQDAADYIADRLPTNSRVASK